MQQQQNQSQFICQKKEHDNCPFAYFQFSDDKEKIFKCKLCILDEPDKENIIVIDQLIKNPIWLVKNYPPLKNKKLQQQIKENLKIQDSDQEKEWINNLKANINEQIVFQYKKIGDQLSKSLKILEKQTLQQFEKMFSGSENKDRQWYDQNYIGMAHYSGAFNTKQQFKKGQFFNDFFENDKTVLNIIFNFNQKLLKIYDDENKGEIQAIIDQKKIQGDLLLGFDIYQLSEEKATLSILDFEC